MDEHGELGERSVVVYDKDGHLIAEHTIGSLKIDDVEGELRRSISSYHWNENSISFFGPDEKLILFD